jgi:hypothetical protein
MAKKIAKIKETKARNRLLYCEVSIAEFNKEYGGRSLSI